MAPFQQLTSSDKEAIREALHAIAYGPIISDWELPIRCHLERSEFRKIVKRWPDLDDTRLESDYAQSTSVYFAINGALNECCHSYEMEALNWGEWFTISRQELIAVFARWRAVHQLPAL